MINERNSRFLHLLWQITKEQSKNDLFLNRFSPRTHSHSFLPVPTEVRGSMVREADHVTSNFLPPIKRLIYAYACGERRTRFRDKMLFFVSISKRRGKNTSECIQAFSWQKAWTLFGTSLTAAFYAFFFLCLYCCWRGWSCRLFNSFRLYFCCSFKFL